MTEREIFEHLFSIASQSTDTDGVVTACLVRDGQIILDAVSAGIEHAEFILLKKMNSANLIPDETYILYSTLQPCDRRSSVEGQKIGDCTTNILKSGIKTVVYAVSYPKSLHSTERFNLSGVSAKECREIEIVKRAIQLFNSTNDDPSTHLPMP
jgi:pyrimidine deaminase RibD-like protein